MKPRDIPNIISIIRIGLVIPLVALLMADEYQLALFLFAVAAGSDALDGFLAKRYGWTSRLGSVLDPIADKLLLVSCFLVLGWLGHIPVWLVTAVIVRDFVILAGAIAYFRLIGEYEMSPSLISKINTFAQLLCGLIVVLSLSVLEIEQQTLQTIFQIAFATTILSGADYVWTWGHKAWQARQSRPRA